MKTDRLLVVFWMMALPSMVGAADLRVHVVGAPVGDVDQAEVRVVSLQGSRTAKTDAAGMAFFADLAEGRYDIRVKSQAFYTKEVLDYKVVADETRPLLINVEFASMSCGEPPDVEYEKSRQGGISVRGKVSNADTNKGMRGARLTFRRTDAPGEKVVIRSQKNGEFATELPPGRYRVVVTNDFFREEDLDLLVAAQETAVVTVALDGSDHIHVCQ